MITATRGLGKMTGFDSMAIEFDLEHHRMQSIAFDQLPTHKVNNKIYWVHCNLNKAEDLKGLTAKLGLPQHVLKLCTDVKAMPNLIDTDDSLTLTIQNITSNAINEQYEIEFGNLIIHLTPNYCFTASTHPSPVLLDVLNQCNISVHYAQTPCFILFLLLEGIINDYAKILSLYEEITEDLDVVVRKSNKNNYTQVMEVKHQVMKMKRHMMVIREILMRITGRNIQVISEACRASLYNLSNHSHLVVNEIDSIRDVLNSLLGQIDNGLMQTMNESMKVLAAFAAIFLPLTLITGIYGMNFVWIPELKWKYGYFGALGLLVACALMLVYVFKKKKWF